MEDQAERFPVFEHPGTEFIHMLKGVIGMSSFLDYQVEVAGNSPDEAGTNP